MTDDGISKEQNRSFWASLPPTVAAPAPIQLHGHRSLKGMPIRQKMRMCERCGISAVRYLAEMPLWTHQGRLGRGLAADYGVTFTPYESRSDASKDAYGRKEQRRREMTTPTRQEIADEHEAAQERITREALDLEKTRAAKYGLKVYGE